MRFPILPTKIAVPCPPASYMARPRLDALWKGWREKRLVLVTAGAGFGKTSFLAAGAARAGRPVRWCTLDEMDADFASFGAHLDHAVRAAARPEQDDDGHAPLDSPKELLAELVRLLRDGGDGQIVILDDVHLVSSSTDVIGFLDRLIRFLPDRVTLILASREQLELSTMRLRSMGGVAAVTPDDLAFTEEEIDSLFHARFPRGRLDRKLLGRIASLTEGWAAGIEIFFQVLEGGAPELVSDALDQLKAAGSGWFPYFAEEVIARLDDDTRDFLYRSSVLPRLDAELCDQVLRIDRSRRILEDLAARHLFTIALPGDGSYRFHNLFHEFLEAQLERHVPAGRVRALRRKAAVALRKRGLLSEAAAAFAAAGDPGATLKLFEQAGEKLLNTGHYASLLRSLESVPPKLLHKSAAGLFLLGRIHEIQGRWDEAEPAYRRALRLTEPGPRRAELMSCLAHHKTRKGDYRGSLALCDKALAEPGRLATRVKGRILATRGVAACDLGRLDEGEEYLEKAAAIFRRRHDRHEEGRLLYILAANVYAHRGEFVKARDAARRSLGIFRKLKNPRRVCHSLGVLGWVTAAGGEIVGGRELTLEALRQSESLGYRMMSAVCAFTLGFCDLADGDREGARRNYDKARAIGEELGEAEMRASPHIGLAETALASGNVAPARKHARAALDVFSRVKDKLLTAQCRMLLGLSYTETRRAAAAAEYDKAEKLIRSAGAAFLLHRLLLVRLDTDRTLGERRAAAALKELLRGASAMEHDALFLNLEPARSARVLPLAIRLDVEPDYAARLLVRLEERAVAPLAELVDHESEAVRMRAIDVLAQIGGDEARRALARAATGAGEAGRSAREAAEELDQAPVRPLEIRALGPLVVRVGDRTIRFDQWKSKRALRLFQLLLVHRFRWVPQDLLLEAFWPEADPRKAKNNLRQTVFLLRKILEPDLKEARLSSYVRNRNEAYRLEAGEGRSLDVLRYEELLREAARHWNGGKRARAEEPLREAIELYRGDYLGESPYEEFAVVEREQLRDRLLKSMQRLLTLYADAERWGDCIILCRRGLALDPYNEEFYWHLVNAHCGEGNRREALADFHQYEEMMMREMDLLPSPRMKQLAERAVLLGKRRA